MPFVYELWVSTGIGRSPNPPTDWHWRQEQDSRLLQRALDQSLEGCTLGTLYKFDLLCCWPARDATGWLVHAKATATQRYIRFREPLWGLVAIVVSEAIRACRAAPNGRFHYYVTEVE